jgi:hypothetical protein
MRRNYAKPVLFITFGALSALAILLQLVYKSFFHEQNEALTMIVISITAVVAILAFVVAVLLYEKLGIERVVREKATLEIIELLSFLRRTVISMYNDQFMSNCFILGLGKDWIKDHESFKVAFPASFFDALEPLQKWGNGILTDKIVASKVQRLIARTIILDIDSGNRTGYIKVRILGSPRIENEQFGRLNNEDMTLEQLLKVFADIKDAAVQWLDKNSKAKYNYNLDSF